MKISKVLICDDSVVERTALRNILTKQGYEVTAVTGGEELIEKSVEEQYDLVFLDLIMPKMDGWETAKILRKNSKYDKVPMLAISSVTSKFDIEKAEFCGIQKVLGKPFKSKDIAEAIASLISK